MGGDEELDDLRAMGVSTAVLKAYAADEDFEVYPEHHEVVTLFVHCATQWNVGFSGRTGLNMQAVETIARAMRVPFDSVLVKSLQLMEITTLNEIQRRQTLKDGVKTHG